MVCCRKDRCWHLCGNSNTVFHLTSGKKVLLDVILVKLFDIRIKRMYGVTRQQKNQATISDLRFLSIMISSVLFSVLFYYKFCLFLIFCGHYCIIFGE